HDRECRGDEGIGWHDYFVTVGDADRAQDHLKRVGAVGDTNAVLHAGKLRECSLKAGDFLTKDECCVLKQARKPLLYPIPNLSVLQFQIDQRNQHDSSTSSSRPPARIERCIASSARTTAIPSRPPVSGSFPVAIHSRKCAHCVARGSPGGTFGTEIFPFGTLARNEANESTYVGGIRTSLTCLS